MTMCTQYLWHHIFFGWDSSWGGRSCVPVWNPGAYLISLHPTSCETTSKKKNHACNAQLQYHLKNTFTCSTLTLASGKVLYISCPPHKVVTNELGLQWLLVRIIEGVFPHGSCLGVIVGGVWIQVVQVFSRVFTDSKISYSSTSFWIKLCTSHVCLVSVFLFIFTIITVIDHSLYVCGARRECDGMNYFVRTTIKCRTIRSWWPTLMDDSESFPDSNSDWSVSAFNCLFAISTLAYSSMTFWCSSVL